MYYTIQNQTKPNLRDAGEEEGELESMAADLGRAEGILYLCKLLRRHKVGTNAIESEAARMWSETCQRSVGAKDKEKRRLAEAMKRWLGKQHSGPEDLN